MQYYICCFKIQYTLQASVIIVYIKSLRPAYESGLFVVHIYSLLMQNFFDFFMFYLLTFNSWSFAFVSIPTYMSIVMANKVSDIISPSLYPNKTNMIDISIQNRVVIIANNLLAFFSFEFSSLLG